MISFPLQNLFLLSLALFVPRAGLEAAQIFSIDIPSQPVASATTNSLVAHAQTWSWRRGTTAPQTDWRTALTADLDVSWMNAPGGFGYGDDAISGEATRVNPGMLNVHTTLYIRHTFAAADVDSNANLLLTVDYDDGFVAYLDGVELARRNVPGAAGSPVSNTATTGGVSHEASCCQTPNPAVVINLGPVGNRLPAGDHILAIIGVNQSLDSSDFHLIADLVALTTQEVTNQPPVVNRGLYAFTTNATVTFQGANSLNGSTRVTVNGDDTAQSGSTWSVTQTLQPGMNHLYFAAHRESGEILSNITQDVVYQASAINVGGVLNGHQTWTGPSIIYVTNDVIIPAGARLEIAPGTVVILPPDRSIIATTNGTLDILGVDGNRVVFLPLNTNSWGWLMANGTNALLNMHYGEVAAGQVRLINRGAGLLEDSIVRDLTDTGREVIASVAGADLTLRRTYMARFTEADSRDTPVLMEACLMEGFLIDGMDIKATNSPLIVRRSTFRDADPNNLNADAVDFGPGAGTVESCLIHHFPDKGVSIGGAPGTVIRDSLIYQCAIGISAYDSPGVVVLNTTIADCRTGILFRNNPTPAFGVATNLIVWGNTTNVAVINTSTLEISFSDIEGTNYPGGGNLFDDPLFVEPAARDYRLGPDSPARGAGFGGVDMGTKFPVGGMPSAPAQVAVVKTSNQVQLVWLDTADNEDGGFIQRSANGLNWETIGTHGPNATNWIDPSPLAASAYYRIRTTNDVGVSEFSNRARGELAGAPTLHIARLNPTEALLSFAAASGRAYRLQSRTNIATGTWSDALSFPAAETNRNVQITNSITTGELYYRMATP